MATDTALLAQLQTLWRAASLLPPVAAPPTGFAATVSDSRSADGTATARGEVGAFPRHKTPPAWLPTADDFAELQADLLDGIADGEQGTDQPGLWVSAEDAALNDGIERDDVPLACRWWRVATFDHLAYRDGRLPAPPAGAEDPFDLLDDQARAYLLGRHRRPERCGFCGGIYRHHPRCVALCDEWAVAMPFGKHKGRPIRNLDTDYLRWIRKSGMALTGEVAGEIDRVLDQRQVA